MAIGRMDEEPPLTEGSLKIMLTESPDSSYNPVVQLLDLRQVNQNRWRVLLNDKRNTYSFAMLGTQLNHMVESGTLPNYSIITIKKFVLNKQGNGKNLIIILEMDVNLPGDRIGQKIGNPMALNDEGQVDGAGGGAAGAGDNSVRSVPTFQQGNARGPLAYGTSPGKGMGNIQQQPGRFDGGPPNKRPNLGATASAGNVFQPRNPAGQTSFRPQQPTYPQVNANFGGGSGSHFPTGGQQFGGQPFSNQSNGGGMGGPSSTANHSMTEDELKNHVVPISALNPYNEHWVICAKVLSKENIRHWQKTTSSGKVFSILVTDGDSDIKVSAFNAECDQFYDMFEVGKTYYIKRGQIKPADARFSRGRMYDMSLKSDSVITECHDNSIQVQIHYNFVPIDQLNGITVDPSRTVDVIGVCKKVGEIFQGKAKTSGKDFSKLDLELMDQTQSSVRVTLWGAQAEKFDATQGQEAIIVVHPCSVSEFGGRSLSALPDAVVEINPDIPEAHQLRGWYAGGGNNCAPQSISAGGTAGGGVTGQAAFKSIWQAEAEGLGNGERPDYFTMKGTVMKAFAKDNTLYRACINSGCNKKVIDNGNGQFRCEKCNSSSEEFHWRLMLLAEIADYSGSAFVTLFQDTAEKILQQDAQTLGRLKTEDFASFEKVITSCQFKSFVFKMRIKMDNYNDEARRKYMVMSLDPVNCAEQTNRMQMALANLGI